MFKRLFLGLIVLFGLLSALPVAAGKSYAAERFDVDITVEEGGALLVKETVVFRFEGGPFTYVFRHIPTDHTDGLLILEAAVDGEALPEGDEAGQVEIEGRDPVKVTWHFDPTSDRTHTFDLTYRVFGVVRQETGADVLTWQPLPEEYEYPIASSTVRIHYAENDTLLGSPAVTQGTAQVEYTDNAATFSMRNLEPDQTLVVSLRFTSGDLIAAPPQWQAKQLARQERTRQWAVPFIVGSAVLLLAGIILPVSYARRFRLPETDSFDWHTVRPPSDLPPAYAGVLYHEGSLQTAWDYALGTLFNLAQRGIVAIEEGPEKKWYRTNEFILHLNPTAEHLLPHERGAIMTFFEQKDGSLAREMRLHQVEDNVYSRLVTHFFNALKTELEDAGFFDETRRRAHNVLSIWGIVLLIISIALAIISAFLLIDLFGLWSLLVAGVLFVVGFVSLIAGVSLSTLSDDAALQMQGCKRFGSYLKAVTRDREVLPHSSYFSEYLPFAAAFGMADAWAHYLKKHEKIELPAWFRALSTSYDQSSGAFVALIVASNATGSSSGASSAAGGAAAGAAGGGASGAG